MKCRKSGILLGPAALFVILSAASVQAADVQLKKVDCDKGKSINEALSKLEPDEPARVEVSGSCTENVVIENFRI